MGIGFLGVGFLGTCLSWILLVHFGRRRIYNIGLAFLAVLQILIGILDCAPNWPNRPNVIWTESSLLVVWNFVYDLTIGPVCFVILCECSATRVRGKTIALATAVQALVGIVMTIAIPYMINPDQANLRGKLGKWNHTAVPASAANETDRILLRRFGSSLPCVELLSNS
jgi:SP family general alpha glucoside:H+ symporter-like MFS transporter